MSDTAEPQLATPTPSPTREAGEGARGRVLVVEDLPLLRERMVRILEGAGYTVLTAPDEPSGRRIVEHHQLDMAFLDLGLSDEEADLPREMRGGYRLFRALRQLAPGVPVVIVTADDTAATAVDMLQAGAFHYINKPIDRKLLLHVAAIGVELGRSRRMREAREDERVRDHTRWHVGQSARMLEAAETVAMFAGTDDSILIQGDTGTGKEVVAKEIHRRSRRATGPFVAVNCAALPKDLLESELFGHERGAFTGALARKRGRMELADGGTLFLDELTSMDPGTQAKVLRALQELSFMRVGGEREIKVDVRVIAASNRDVKEAMAAGDFRPDLYYRLCGVPIELPPLKARVADIAHLASFFIDQRRTSSGLAVNGLSERAALALCGYDWPGNIRELKNVVERATVIAAAKGSPCIDVVHLPADIVAGGDERSSQEPNAAVQTEPGGLPGILPADGLDLPTVRDAWEARMMRQALGRKEGKQAPAARLLHLTRDMFRSRMAKFGIEVDASVVSDEDEGAED